jgi:ornithine cyclodeaminase
MTLSNTMNPAHTLFLSAPAAAELINRHGIPQTLRGMRDAIAEDFARWADFDKSARVANHSTHGVIELMPIADDTLYSFKYVNGHPKNTGLGLSTVMAFGVLADVATGTPLLLSELTLTTALRTAATSALAAQTLAQPAATMRMSKESVNAAATALNHATSYMAHDQIALAASSPESRAARGQALR